MQSSLAYVLMERKTFDINNIPRKIGTCGCDLTQSGYSGLLKHAGEFFLEAEIQLCCETVCELKKNT